MVDKKTTGECLRNNWNSINTKDKEERVLRISIQNDFSINGNFDYDFYMKYFWNEEVEDE